MLPRPIDPDTKSWTWVLERRCPECGFDAASFDVRHTGAKVRDVGKAWEAVLHKPHIEVRPAPTTWSPLEYACHVRDVLGLFDHRLALMLDEDDPQFENWDQDATAIHDRYDLQDADDVSRALAARAEAIACRFDAVEGAQWSRTGRRSDGVLFTVTTFARYFIHDPIHHLADVAWLDD